MTTTPIPDFEELRRHAKWLVEQPAPNRNYRRMTVHAEEILTLLSERETLVEKVRVLSEALKPFADLGREFGDEHWKDDEVVLGHEVRDHRRAARALSPEPIGASNG